MRCRCEATHVRVEIREELDLGAANAATPYPPCRTARTGTNAYAHAPLPTSNPSLLTRGNSLLPMASWCGHSCFPVSRDGCQSNNCYDTIVQQRRTGSCARGRTLLASSCTWTHFLSPFTTPFSTSLTNNNPCTHAMAMRPTRAWLPNDGGSWTPRTGERQRLGANTGCHARSERHTLHAPPHNPSRPHDSSRHHNPTLPARSWRAART